ncbi:MAG: site-specific DNA-methyltransferase, partial [Thermoanaerobacteraceae bacterium]|nr:site-specific DNA-methyltransferase [Thermoanaerobacteraceae bacterium]
MEKLKMKSRDITRENIEKIGRLFPNVITEIKDEKGNITRAIDFELLQQELCDEIVEGSKERYQITWPGKKEALILANTPTNKTLRPVKEDSLNWESTQNLFIEGDNLEVLKLLQESYLNKIKLIYIDPPYNTGNDFIYKDKFTLEKTKYAQESGQIDQEGNRLFQITEYHGRYHSDWLTMIYPRLKLARNLLS